MPLLPCAKAQTKTTPEGVAVRRLVGGAREDRTPDLLNAIQALSHLSYDPVTNFRLRGPLRMGAVYWQARRGARGKMHFFRA
jgi:hypothetical protein